MIKNKIKVIIKVYTKTLTNNATTMNKVIWSSSDLTLHHTYFSMYHIHNTWMFAFFLTNLTLTLHFPSEVSGVCFESGHAAQCKVSRLLLLWCVRNIPGLRSQRHEHRHHLVHFLKGWTYRRTITYTQQSVEIVEKMEWTSSHVSLSPWN